MTGLLAQLQQAKARLTAARAYHDRTREAHIKAQVEVKEAEMRYRSAEKDYIDEALAAQVES